MTAILNLAVALLAGLLMTRIFSRWHLPDVTAFLVTGVLIGPFVLGRLGIPGLGFASYDQVEALSMISDVAMGFIAFSIGNEFRLSQLKKTGRQAMIIGVLQALAALAFVDKIDPRDCRLKVGKEMFTLFGPQFVRELQQRGFDIFLDLKFHDIPNTAAHAVAAAAHRHLRRAHHGDGRVACQP